MQFSKINSTDKIIVSWYEKTGISCKVLKHPKAAPSAWNQVCGKQLLFKPQPGLGLRSDFYTLGNVKCYFNKWQSSPCARAHSYVQVAWTCGKHRDCTHRETKRTWRVGGFLKESKPAIYLYSPSLKAICDRIYFWNTPSVTYSLSINYHKFCILTYTYCRKWTWVSNQGTSYFNSPGDIGKNIKSPHSWVTPCSLLPPTPSSALQLQNFLFSQT